MAWAIDTRPKCRLSPKLAAGLILVALFTLGTFAGSASAQGRGNENRDKHHNWNGGYYRAPPIIYGSPYGQTYYGSPYYDPPRYYPPPVVYGPGLNFNFQIR
jgi:hypothetical protein